MIEENYQPMRMSEVNAEPRTLFPLNPGKKIFAADKERRRVEALRGRAHSKTGVIGYARFPTLDEEGFAFTLVTVFASTMPLEIEGAMEPDQAYSTLSSGDVTVYVSDNAAEASSSFRRSALAAVSTVMQPATRTFNGRRLFLTFAAARNSMDDEGIFVDGPSCGLAIYAAVNGLVSHAMFTGELAVTNAGFVTLLPIDGLGAKLSFLHTDSPLLIAPANADDLGSINVPYVGPQAARLGYINMEDERPKVVLVADLGSVTVVSSSHGILVSNNSRTAPPPPKGEPVDSSEILPVVTFPALYSEEVLAEKLEAWRNQGWPANTRQKYQAWVDASNALRAAKFEGVPFPNWMYLIINATKALNINENRVKSALARTDLITLGKWVRQANEAGPTKPPGTGKNRNKKKGKPKAPTTVVPFGEEEPVVAPETDMSDYLMLDEGDDYE